MPTQLETGHVYNFAYRGDRAYADDEYLPAFPQPTLAPAPFTVRDHPQDDDAYYIRVVKGSDDAEAPVLLWVHGGSILSGSAAFAIYDPAVFAKALGCTIISVNYRLGLASRPRTADGGLAFDRDCFAVEDVLAAFERGKQFLRDSGETFDRVFLGGHSVGATMIFGIAERFAHEVNGVIAATPILEPLYAADRSALVARHDTDSASLAMSAPERVEFQQTMVDEWVAGEHGAEVLGLWRPQFGETSYPWENESWRLPLPLFATWSEGEYAEYGDVLKARAADQASKPGDIMRPIEIDDRFGLNARQMHLAATPIFFGNEDDWQGSMLDEYVASDDYQPAHIALTTEIRQWMAAQQ